jgi:hypothetical protein
LSDVPTEPRPASPSKAAVSRTTGTIHWRRDGPTN